VRYNAPFALAIVASVLPIRSAGAQERLSTPAPRGPAIHLYAFGASGWTVRETDAVDNRVTDVELGRGGGVGANLMYDLSSWIAGYAGAELGVEREGAYGSYGVGVLLRMLRTGSARFHGRIGARVIDVVTTLPYADIGIGGELFVSRSLALASDLSTEVPLGDGSRNTGLRPVGVSARGGPERISIGISWYLDR
jgi:hypothetical protein